MDSAVALHLAVEAAHYIEQQRIDDVWRLTNDHADRVDHTLYHGTAGIILFFLELADATGSPIYETRAHEAGRVLATWVGSREQSSVAFATGWGGFGFTLLELHRRTEDPVFKVAADYAHTMLMTQATTVGSGVGWVEPAPFGDITGFRGEREIYDLSVGAAGAGLALLPHFAEFAVKVGDRLLDVAERRPEGLRWSLMSEMPFPFTAPNFAHGGAGVGYFLGRLFEVTGESRFLLAAVEAGQAFIAATSPVGDGVLAHHTEELQPPQFYLGACHGPAGSGRLLALLGKLTGNSMWTDQLDLLLKGVDSLGAPETRSWGWWNNHSRCCGDAGLGDAALLFDRVPGADSLAARQLANRCAAVIAGASVSGSAPTGEAESADSQLPSVGCWWPQAEHRARPKFVQNQTGYMQGAAGIGSFLVHLATHDAPTPVRIALPDELL